jgi:hypothetical protein
MRLMGAPHFRVKKIRVMFKKKLFDPLIAQQKNPKGFWKNIFRANWIPRLAR